MQTILSPLRFPKPLQSDLQMPIVCTLIDIHFILLLTFPRSDAALFKDAFEEAQRSNASAGNTSAPEAEEKSKEVVAPSPAAAETTTEETKTEEEKDEKGRTVVEAVTEEAENRAD